MRDYDSKWWQLPYQRGSPKTETIRDYPAYPAYLNEYLSNQTIPVQAFNTVNAARDIIASVKAEKARDPLVDHYVIALSYGSDLLNEILLSEPALFKTAIFDGISVSRFKNVPDYRNASTH